MFEYADSAPHPQSWNRVWERSNKVLFKCCCYHRGRPWCNLQNKIGYFFSHLLDFYRVMEVGQNLELYNVGQERKNLSGYFELWTACLFSVLCTSTAFISYTPLDVNLLQCFGFIHVLVICLARKWDLHLSKHVCFHTLMVTWLQNVLRIFVLNYADTFCLSYRSFTTEKLFC